MTESEIRENGFDWNNVQRAFLWQNLSKDFMRQLVEYDQTYKTQLENHLLMAVHGYASYPSYFYQNMYSYIKSGLSQQRQLKYYANEIYMMYRQQAEKEFNDSRNVYRITDSMGRTLDQWVM